MSNDLWRLSACETAAGIKGKHFTAEAVVDSVADRIKTENPRLNAIVLDLTEEAFAQAHEADRQIADGEDVGPLHGVPVTIKSNVDVKGQPTPNGLPALAEVIASDDSPVVSNFKKSGAIIMGRTNTPELSMRLTTDNPLFGRTLNPWDDQASPGGSSGGASAAAAAGFGPIHHGNDIGGSLRCPSFNCGLSTVKPTFGRVPAFLPSALEERGLLSQLISVQGPICREVRDVRLSLKVMSAADSRDPFWMPVAFDDWPEAKKPIRVGVTTESYGHPIHPEIIESIDRAAGYLSDAGYQVESVTPPSINDAASAWFTYLGAELEAFLMPSAKAYGSEMIQQIFEWYFEMGQVAKPAEYQVGIKNRTAMTRKWNQFLEDTPLLLSPYFLQPTPDWDCDAKSLEGTRALFDSAIYSTGINWVSLPAGVTPIGMIAGRPAGVQIIGQRFREDLILDAMEAIESRVGILTQQLWARED